MCVPDAKSPAQQLNIVIFPILTGTSSVDLRQEVAGFGSKRIQLSPFTFTESTTYLDNHMPGFNAITKSPRFIRVLMSMGGIPQMVKILKNPIMDDPSLDHIIQTTSSDINTQNKIDEKWESVCQTQRNLDKVFALSISNYGIPC
eukprot:gene16321-19413_t